MYNDSKGFSENELSYLFISLSIVVFILCNFIIDSNRNDNIIRLSENKIEINKDLFICKVRLEEKGK
jgi:hypothetical protein